MPRKYGKTAQKKVQKAMHEMKEGKLRSGRSGKKVSNSSQAVAIGLDEARRAGAPVPKPAKKKRATRAQRSVKRKRAR